MAVTQLGAMDYDRHQSYQMTALVLTLVTLLAAGLSLTLLPWGRSAAARELVRS